APGSGDLAANLALDARFIYTIDPSIVSLEISKLGNAKHIQGFFEAQTIKPILKHKVDCVVFRHLLEHIYTPALFLKEVVDLLEEDGLIYVEVPNIDEFIDNKRFYEIFNDHCGYYQKSVLINHLSKLHCELVDELFLYENQHMGLFFKKKKATKQSYLTPRFYDFKKDFDEAITKLNDELKAYSNIAIYGAGAHANSFLCFLSKQNLANIQLCFDLDNRKQGKFLQHSNIAIKEPTLEHLQNIKAIIIAAPLYEEEIYKFLVSLGFKGKIIKTRIN
ncbi:SAM-dependent methyltransferase, partial [Campylobacter sp. MIT 97-5078]|uniref:class I SAM-dependent methyltransferase n=1 Tax=Campylobacter sp. MIT 97-5078 TaxID=1548153 RepID=UPI0011604107